MEEHHAKKKEITISLRSLILWVVIAILAIAVIYVSFFQGDGSSSREAIDATQTAARAAASSSGMVGGC